MPNIIQPKRFDFRRDKYDGRSPRGKRRALFRRRLVEQLGGEDRLTDLQRAMVSAAGNLYLKLLELEDTMLADPGDPNKAADFGQCAENLNSIVEQVTRTATAVERVDA